MLLTGGGMDFKNKLNCYGQRAHCDGKGPPIQPNHLCLPEHQYRSSIQKVGFYLGYVSSCFDDWKQKFHVSTSKEAIQVC